MLSYFNRAHFMLAHCLIDDNCLPVFENIYILIIVLLCFFIYVFIFIYFLKFILSIFWRTTLETSVLLCALMCKYYIYMYYNVLPNKPTHSQNLNMQRLRGALFADMSRLSMLLLGRNNIGASIANDTRHVIFARNTDLRLLDLAGCHITEIPPDEFSDLRHLRVLNLSMNEIVNFTVRLNKLTSLRLLNISHNRLTTLPLTTLKELDHVAQRRMTQVDISANPLVCDSEFVTWAKTTKVHFMRAEQTLCEGDNGTRPVEFGVVTTLSDRLVYDVDNHDRTVAIAVSLSVIALAIPILVFVLYRCRWKLALCCHRMKTGTPSAETPRDRTYKRDAFICYNSNDREWVCGDLLRHLEDNAVSTILHHRDFLPGSVLEDTIRESVAMSRFVVLVLSPDFLASNWCLLEMHLARSRVTSEGLDVIVPVILREFPATQVM